MADRVTIRPARFPEDGDEVRALFLEYARSTGVDLSFQDFDRELLALPGEYQPPLGALLVAASGAVLVGCVALRPFDQTTAEMKRLFVSGSARGTGAGLALVEAIVAAGRGAGYRAIRLDTLPTQSAAQRLYQRAGFADIPPYRHNPIAGTRFLELKF